MGGDPVTLGTL